MKPIKLRVTNFKAFRKTQEYVFPDKPGLYFVQGVNESEPRLGSNGAGKTTLWDALCWCMYGKTPKGLKSGDVCNWDAGKGATVEFDVALPEGEYVTLLRQWGPIKAFVRWPDGTEEDIDKNDTTSGLPFASFLHCILMAQNQPMFLDMKPEPQAALFAEVLELDQWLDFAQTASQYASACASNCVKLERDIEYTRGELKTLERVHLKDQADAWIAEQAKIIDDLKERYESDKKNAMSLDKVRAAEADEAAARADLKRMMDAKPDDKRCPECGQLVVAERDREAERKLRDYLSFAVSEAQQLRSSYQRAQQNLDRLEDELHAAINHKNPYADMMRRHEEDTRRAAEELRVMHRDLDDERYKQSLYTFWTSGFKEVRLYLISEALNELEIEVNNAVTALGLVDWELRFQIDRETKSGSIARGFNVFVKSPHNEQLVPWEAWSGGESQRLRIAATMGLSDLIRSRAGIDIPLEVWDEATNNLSKEGADDLLVALAWRAQQEQRVIFLVDHRALNFGDFAGYVTIIKTPSGSRIRQDNNT